VDNGKSCLFKYIFIYISKISITFAALKASASFIHFPHGSKRLRYMTPERQQGVTLKVI